jgi:hypothetical protein
MSNIEQKAEKLDVSNFISFLEETPHVGIDVEPEFFNMLDNDNDNGSLCILVICHYASIWQNG